MTLSAIFNWLCIEEALVCFSESNRAEDYDKVRGGPQCPYKCFL